VVLTKLRKVLYWRSTFNFPVVKPPLTSTTTNEKPQWSLYYRRSERPPHHQWTCRRMITYGHKEQVDTEKNVLIFGHDSGIFGVSLFMIEGGAFDANITAIDAYLDSKGSVSRLGKASRRKHTKDVHARRSLQTVCGCQAYPCSTSTTTTTCDHFLRLPLPFQSRPCRGGRPGLRDGQVPRVQTRYRRWSYVVASATERVCDFSIALASWLILPDIEPSTIFFFSFFPFTLFKELCRQPFRSASGVALGAFIVGSETIPTPILPWTTSLTLRCRSQPVIVTNLDSTWTEEIHTDQ
jgi:hypothetical protein